ncbi:MAG: hypothetical protein RL417_1400 [Pseudomonadota bacterium]
MTMRIARNVALLSLLAFLVFLGIVPEGRAEAPAYMGTGSCSSSNCHGSVSPRKATNVLQNEYVTWQKHDLHAQAWLNLGNEDSKRIAYHLGIKDAQKDPLCLSCHATYHPNARQGKNFQIEDGVGCESCHGPGEKYLGPHTANDASHAKNIENGMMDIVAPSKRAALCVTCHIGNDEKSVSHRLIGAGHPRLSFELDTFGMLEPKHWLVDDDYKNRKEDYSPVKAWLIGQAEVADAMIDTTLSKTRSRDGQWPELTQFYCYSCHHSLAEDQWKSRDYGGRPGELRLNVSSLIILREALKATDPALSTALAGRMEDLHKRYKDGTPTETLKAIKGVLGQVRNAVYAKSYDKGALERMLKLVTAYGAENGGLQYEVAEQIAMGMSSIVSARSPDGKLYKAQIDAVYAALATPDEFRAEDFTSACSSFVKSL